MDEREETLAERMHREGWRTRPTGNVVRSVDGEEQSMWPHRELYEAMCELEKPPAPTAEQTLSELARIQMLEELLENSDAAFAWQRDRAEDAESQVERLQERIRDLENERMREESREAELAVALDQERKCRDRIQELEQKLRDSFPREYVEKWQEERRRVEALCVERYDRIQELEEHFERQRGEPVGWVFMPNGSNEPTALYWKRMQPAMVLARATWEAKGLARHTLYAGPPEPAEQDCPTCDEPADDPATAEARIRVGDTVVPRSGFSRWSKAVVVAVDPAYDDAAAEHERDHMLYLQVSGKSVVTCRRHNAVLAERDTDPEMPSLPDARAGYDAGDEDDYDGKVL